MPKHDRPNGGSAITANAHGSGEAADLLIDAGAVLASSLDLSTTMAQVARLTIPTLADLCVIDLRTQDGSIAEAAVASTDPKLANDLERLRARYPIDPQGAHPVARVIADGEPALLPAMSAATLESFAQSREHARFMIENDYRSAIVAPLRARSRTLGAISVLRFGGHDPYADDDLELVSELARRAALALDNARLYGELRALERRQEAILTNLAEAITVEDADGRTVFANQAAANLLQVSSPGDITSAVPGSIAARFLILDEQARELELDQLPGRRLFGGEQPEPLLVRNIVRATGQERWLLVRSSPIANPDSGRVEYAVNVFENITEVKRAQLAESFMAQASRVLSSSLDYAETLRHVARLAVPAIADWCAIELVNERGAIEQVAVHHADPAKVAVAARLGEHYQPPLDQATGVPEVIRTGTSRIYTDISPASLTAYARDSEHLDLLSAVGANAVIIVPLMSAVQTLGAITLVTSESLRRLSSSDVALAERLGRRAGTAVENSRLYTERSRIAHVLQQALLPESLPPVEGAEVEARYCAAGELNEVGGDFYDVFTRGPDRWMLVIGDVVGKGPRAAGVTALARHTLRAASMSGHTPEAMLAMLHQALRGQPEGADLCTVCLVEVHRTPQRTGLTVALAGHPPPLVIDGDGRAAPVGRPGTLLGVFDPVRVHEVELELSQGQTLLLYTDGVLDAGRMSAPLGERGLLELCREARGLGLGEMLERIEAAALQRAEGARRDDIALLGFRLADAHGARG